MTLLAVFGKVHGNMHQLMSFPLGTEHYQDIISDIFSLQSIFNATSPYILM